MSALHFRLAWQMMKKGKEVYLPFFMTSVLCTAMMYLVCSLANNSDILNMPGGEQVAMMLAFGQGIIFLFAFVFLLYSYSFLQKSQKQQLGLLHVLGLSKRQMAGILVIQLLMMLAGSLVVGIAVGILLDQGFFLLFARLLKADVILHFQIQAKALKLTCGAVCAMFVVLMLFSAMQMMTMNAIDLLRSQSQGQKAPKSRWLLTIFGLLCLAGGYGLAVTLQSPMAAFMFFFAAVILVMAGTYALFIAGTITLLNSLQKNKSYYYKTSHFLTIGTMKHRMKSNAVSLASISILSTMILVALSSTVCLWAGQDSIIQSMYPREMTIQVIQPEPGTMDTIETVLTNMSIPAENVQSFSSLIFTGFLDGPLMSLSSSSSGNTPAGEMTMVNITDLEDWNRLSGNSQSLQENEILLYSPSGKTFQTLTMGGKEWTVKPIDDTFNSTDLDVYAALQLYVVVPTYEDLVNLYQWNRDFYSSDASSITDIYRFDIPSSIDAPSLASELSEALTTAGIESALVISRVQEAESSLAFFGGFLFLGIFVSLMLLISCIVIMYYKQISEGLEDSRRFAIMSAVGLDKRQIQKTIRFQVLIVFFLPMVMAFIHLAFAFPMISRLLVMFGFRDTWMFAGVCAATAGCFAILYLICYALTSRVYYRLISQRSLADKRQ